MGSPVQRLPEFGQITAVTMGYGVVLNLTDRASTKGNQHRGVAHDIG
jgi:hypothetical protein